MHCDNKLYLSQIADRWIMKKDRHIASLFRKHVAKKNASKLSSFSVVIKEHTQEQDEEDISPLPPPFFVMVHFLVYFIIYTYIVYISIVTFTGFRKKI